MSRSIEREELIAAIAACQLNGTAKALACLTATDVCDLAMPSRRGVEA